MAHHAELPLWDDKSDPQKIETMHQMLLNLYEVTYAEARRDLRKVLQAAIAGDKKEHEDITMMLDLLEKHPNIMSSNCEVAHFTGSALVCDYAGRILLHHHKTLNRWLQFGGHADDEMNFADVALRETIEETGLLDLHHYPIVKQPQPIDFDVHMIPAKGNRPEHLHLDLRYLLLTEEPQNLNPPAGESQQLLWLTYDNIINPKDPADANLIEPALKRLIRKCHKINHTNIKFYRHVRRHNNRRFPNKESYTRRKRHHKPPKNN